MSQDFDNYMRNVKKIKKYDEYVRGFNLFCDYLSNRNMKLDEINKTVLSDYMNHMYSSYRNWEIFKNSYGNYILRFYLEFNNYGELILHLDKLKEDLAEQSKKYDKERKDKPKFVVNLENELEKYLERKVIDKILGDKEGIKQNSSAKKKSCFICGVMQRLETEVDEKTFQKILASGLHKRSIAPSSVVMKYKKLYQKLGDIDALLEQMHIDWVEYMAKNYGDNKEAMEFIRTKPLYGYWGGVREGNKLLKAKFPYNILKHLEATDEVEKRYHYCHCGWVKETIRDETLEITGDFCYCGAGWSKQLWEAIFDEPIETELLETVLDKEERCLFVFTLPDKALKNKK